MIRSSDDLVRNIKAQHVILIFLTRLRFSPGSSIATSSDEL